MSDDALPRKPREAGGDDSPPLAWLMRRLRTGPRRSDDPVREAIEELMESEGDGDSIDAHERLLLANMLRLRDLTAYDVMIPRADVVAVEINTPLTQVAALIGQCGHSRLPVYRKTLDDALGMIHIKDLLVTLTEAPQPNNKPTELRSLIRRVLFVSPAIRVLDLLLEMRLKRTHLALVVDEYGGIDGLVTIEDMIEQIVGEIEDEHETEAEPELVIAEDGTVTADARLPLEDFETRFHVTFSDDDNEDTDTLGGLVVRMLGRVPARGELVRHPLGMEFEVVDADPRRLRRLRIRHLPPQPGEAPSS